jgi:hypothetical protein
VRPLRLEVAGETARCHEARIGDAKVRPDRLGDLGGIIKGGYQLD